MTMASIFCIVMFLTNISFMVGQADNGSTEIEFLSDQLNPCCSQIFITTTERSCDNSYLGVYNLIEIDGSKFYEHDHYNDVKYILIKEVKQQIEANRNVTLNSWFLRQEKYPFSNKIYGMENILSSIESLLQQDNECPSTVSSWNGRNYSDDQCKGDCIWSEWKVSCNCSEEVGLFTREIIRNASGDGRACEGDIERTEACKCEENSSDARETVRYKSRESFTFNYQLTPQVILSKDHTNKGKERYEACREGEFRCSYGKCIPENFRCDGENDCEDGSDEARKCINRNISFHKDTCHLTPEEEHLFCDNWKCSNQFSCNQENTACTKIANVCDGKYDCPNGQVLDEQNCDIWNCHASHQFPCALYDISRLSDSPKCISRNRMCNGILDCEDWSDESYENCKCHEECSDIYDPVCGTDHQTYSNECNLKLQSCQTRNKNLTLAYSGECIDCIDDCSDVYDPVCGTDETTYINECHLNVMACIKKNNRTELKISYPGKCQTAQELFPKDVSVTCLQESLNRCCKHFSIITIPEDDSFISAEIDHLLGYYKIEGIHNDVFYYRQQTVRHNIFDDSDPVGLEITFVPVFLNVYQEYVKDEGPRWYISKELGSTNIDKDVIAMSPTGPPTVCPPLSGWKVKIPCDYLDRDTLIEGKLNRFETIHSCINTERDFGPAVNIEMMCLDDEHFKVCNQCLHPDAECVYDFNLHNFQCRCKAGYEGDGKLCAKILGEINCWECEGKLCNTVDEKKHERRQCEIGSSACQMFITAVDDIRNVLFKRMCAPVGKLTNMECIGLRSNDNILDFPQERSSNDRVLLRERFYNNVPFICGPSLDCVGTYTTSKEKWEINCSGGKQEIVCYHKDNQTTYRYLEDKSYVEVKCIGQTKLVMLLSEKQMKQIELPNLNELGGQGMIPGFVKSNLSNSEEDEERKKYKVDIPGFARYFRKNLSQYSPYFMECSLTNMAITTGLPSNSSLEGVLCTCNKDYCNNASSTDIHEMFSDASRVSYLYLYICICLLSIWIVIINFTL